MSIKCKDSGDKRLERDGGKKSKKDGRNRDRRSWKRERKGSRSQVRVSS